MIIRAPENPADIRRAIMDACPDALEFDDRREAIAAAIDAAQVGDIVLVAGRARAGSDYRGHNFAF